jgi:aspartyl-tRNA(Asn)/glutamyl-tRNA(Gln) amidotransferase subunit A
MTVGIPVNHYFDRVAPDVAEVVHRMTDRLAEAGATLRRVTVPNAGVLAPVFWAIMIAEAGAYHEQTLRTQAELYQPDVRALLERGREVTAVDYIKASRVRTMLKKEWRSMFTGIDALLAPTTPVTAPAVGASVVDCDGSVEDVTSALVRLNNPANVVGLPAVTVPCGLGGNGLPIGVQVIGRPFAERTVLRVGRSLEQTSDMPRRMPPLAMTTAEL